MSIPPNIYSAKELAALDDKAKETLRRELKRQIQTSPEIRAIVKARKELNKILKERLRDTYTKLTK